MPAPSLRPVDPEARARSRMLSRLIELYVMGAVTGLLPMMPISLHKAPIARDQKLIDLYVPQLAKALDNVEHFLAKNLPFAVTTDLTTADATLASFVPFVRAVETYLGLPGLIESRPRLGGLVKRHPETPLLQRIFGEVSNAMQERRKEVQAKFGLV